MQLNEVKAEVTYPERGEGGDQIEMKGHSCDLRGPQYELYQAKSWGTGSCRPI
jgi:hypothetical protein